MDDLIEEDTPSSSILIIYTLESNSILVGGNAF